jgi:DNA repair protein RadC
MIILKDANLKVTSAVNVANLLQNWLLSLDDVDRDKEHFFTVLFDTRNNLKAVDVISVGTINASLVHPREVYKRAILESAVWLIIAHNHPSGDNEPSEEDLKVTERLVDAGKILGIELLDHIILGSKPYYSFREKGIM